MGADPVPSDAQRGRPVELFKRQLHALFFGQVNLDFAMRIKRSVGFYPDALARLAWFGPIDDPIEIEGRKEGQDL